MLSYWVVASDGVVRQVAVVWSVLTRGVGLEPEESHQRLLEPVVDDVVDVDAVRLDLWPCWCLEGLVADHDSHDISELTGLANELEHLRLGVKVDINTDLVCFWERERPEARGELGVDLAGDADLV